MFDSIRETCYVYIWYYVIPLLEQYSVCYVQYSFMSFDILLLTFWHYCKICRFPKLTVWKEYSINLFTIQCIKRPIFFTILLFFLNGNVDWENFRLFFFYQFHRVNNQYIHYHIKTLWSLIEIIPFYSAFFFWRQQNFQCINVMFNSCACMCDLIIHC